MVPVASQSILFRIIGITMFMCLAIVNMVTSKGRGGHDDDHDDGHDRGGHGGGHGRGHDKD